jgi:hypothetical protein
MHCAFKSRSLHSFPQRGTQTEKTIGRRCLKQTVPVAAKDRLVFATEMDLDAAMCAMS